jgi:hypothetical protein
MHQDDDLEGLDIESIEYVGPIAEEIVTNDLRFTGQSKMAYSFVVINKDGRHEFIFDTYSRAMWLRQLVARLILER